ncbi:hypothetical protein E2C01_018224 [Portunus trituberculatus]|uniref:Uncharacterized protein n=1 Tax=Portunus trituberculatus TaxID=210409 RepID=A0A5B7DVU5_PORTR|nr:hypothetical protein [Portunus trituberculatus]
MSQVGSSTNTSGCRPKLGVDGCSPIGRILISGYIAPSASRKDYVYRPQPKYMKCGSTRNKYLVTSVASHVISGGLVDGEYTKGQSVTINTKRATSRKRFTFPLDSYEADNVALR